MAKISKLRKKYEGSIQNAVSNGFEAELLSAAFDNLENSGPLCFNNFAYALRELIRHVLNRLAPADEIKECRWFKPDKTAGGGITRAHRAIYSIQGGLSESFVRNQLKIDVKGVLSGLLGAIETLNKYTHIEPSTMGISQKDIYALTKQCLSATKYFVDHIFECRSRVALALSEAIDEHLLNEIISETVASLDEIATHHFIDEIYVEEVVIVSIGPKSLRVLVAGSVGVELQYGSNADVRNDIGAIILNSFPFSAELTIKFVRPLGRDATVDKFKVNTNKWYE